MNTMPFPDFVSFLTDSNVSLISGVTIVLVLSCPIGVSIFISPVWVIRVLASVAVRVYSGCLVRRMFERGIGVCEVNSVLSIMRLDNLL